MMAALSASLPAKTTLRDFKASSACCMKRRAVSYCARPSASRRLVHDPLEIAPGLRQQRAHRLVGLGVGAGVLHRQRRLRRRRGRRRSLRPVPAWSGRGGSRRAGRGERGDAVTASVDTGSAGRGGSGRYSATTRGGASGAASVGSGAGVEARAVAHPLVRAAAARPQTVATTRGSMPAL